MYITSCRHRSNVSWCNIHTIEPDMPFIYGLGRKKENTFLDIHTKKADQSSTLFKTSLMLLLELISVENSDTYFTH
jgi:hypothetical protein